MDNKPDWEKLSEEADSGAKQAASANARQDFKMLPGDPVKGTRYFGLLKAVDFDVDGNPNNENYGRDKLTVEILVTEGTYRGFIEKFWRILNPVSLDALNDEDFERKVNDLVGEGKSRTEAADAVLIGWKKWRENYRRQTYEMFAKLGVEIENTTDQEMVDDLFSKAGGQRVEFTIYDKDDRHPRRKFLEYLKPSHGDGKQTDTSTPLFDLKGATEVPIE